MEDDRRRSFRGFDQPRGDEVRAEESPYEQYFSEQIVHIAENLVAAQNEDGGWPKNKDWITVYPANQLVGTRPECAETRQEMSPQSL